MSGALDGRVAVHDLSAYASTENPTKGTLRAAVCDFERPILNVSCTISSAGTVQSLVTIDNRGKLQASRLSRPFIDRVKSTLSGPWPALLSLEEGSTKLSVVELRPESFARNRVADPGDALVRATFTPCGKYIYLAAPKASIVALEAATQPAFAAGFTYAASIPKYGKGKGKASISGANNTLSAPDHGQAYISGNGLLCVVRSAVARKQLHIIRIKNGPAFENLQIIQDPVNGVRWGTCCFSGDSEYLAVSAIESSKHSLNVYSLSSTAPGRLVKMLQPDDRNGKGWCVLDADWHPKRPCVASVAYNGHMVMFTKSYTENWSAFAPDFEPIDYNIDYEEKEDEFDEPSRGTLESASADQDDDIIDVCGHDDWENGHNSLHFDVKPSSR